MIPTTNAIHCQADIGILQLLKKIATDNDVNIRILAPLNDYSVEQKVVAAGHAKRTFRPHTKRDPARMAPALCIGRDVSLCSGYGFCLLSLFSFFRSSRIFPLV